MTPAFSEISSMLLSIELSRYLGWVLLCVCLYLWLGPKAKALLIEFQQWREARDRLMRVAGDLQDDSFAARQAIVGAARDASNLVNEVRSEAREAIDAVREGAPHVLRPVKDALVMSMNLQTGAAIMSTIFYICGVIWYVGSGLRWAAAWIWKPSKVEETQYTGKAGLTKLVLRVVTIVVGFGERSKWFGRLVFGDVLTENEGMKLMSLANHRIRFYDETIGLFSWLGSQLSGWLDEMVCIFSGKEQQTGEDEKHDTNANRVHSSLFEDRPPPAAPPLNESESAILRGGDISERALRAQFKVLRGVAENNKDIPEFIYYSYLVDGWSGWWHAKNVAGEWKQITGLWYQLKWTIHCLDYTRFDWLRVVIFGSIMFFSVGIMAAIAWAKIRASRKTLETYVPSGSANFDPKQPVAVYDPDKRTARKINPGDEQALQDALQSLVERGWKPVVVQKGKKIWFKAEPPSPPDLPQGVEECYLCDVDNAIESAINVKTSLSQATNLAIGSNDAEFATAMKLEIAESVSRKMIEDLKALKAEILDRVLDVTWNRPGVSLPAPRPVQETSPSAVPAEQPAPVEQPFVKVEKKKRKKGKPKKGKVEFPDEKHNDTPTTAPVIAPKAEEKAAPNPIADKPPSIPLKSLETLQGPGMILPNAWSMPLYVGVGDDVKFVQNVTMVGQVMISTFHKLSKDMTYSCRLDGQIYPLGSPTFHTTKDIMRFLRTQTLQRASIRGTSVNSLRIVDAEPDISTPLYMHFWMKTEDGTLVPRMSTGKYGGRDNFSEVQIVDSDTVGGCCGGVWCRQDTGRAVAMHCKGGVDNRRINFGFALWDSDVRSFIMESKN